MPQAVDFRFVSGSFNNDYEHHYIVWFSDTEFTVFFSWQGITQTRDPLDNIQLMRGLSYPTGYHQRHGSYQIEEPCGPAKIFNLGMNLVTYEFHATDEMLAEHWQGAIDYFCKLKRFALPFQEEYMDSDEVKRRVLATADSLMVLRGH